MAYFKTGFLNDKRILVTNLKWAEGGGGKRSLFHNQSRIFITVQMDFKVKRKPSGFLKKFTNC